MLAADTVSLLPPPAFERTSLITLHPPRLSYALPDDVLPVEALEARVAGRSLRFGEEIVFDVVERRIILRAPFQSGDTLRLRYRILPVGLAASYGDVPRWASETDSLGPEAPVRVASLGVAGLPLPAPRPTSPESVPAASTRTSGPQLDITGSKSLVVESGSQRDATLRQSLDVSAAGNLGGGVRLTAVLSDRDAPVAAGGGTLDLDEIDQVLIEVQHENATGRLGDYTMRQDLGHYGRFERRGSGAQVEGRFAGNELQGSLAQSKGRYHSVRLLGQEGRQGPYALTDESGGSPVAVVSGSETVWLDGERLQRGESADYSIDYARGTLQFSPRRIVVLDARIVVDFQIATTAYTRLATRGAGRVRRGGLELYGHAFREADDAARPLTGALTAAQEDRLADSGDAADSALALPSEHALAGGGARFALGSILRLEAEGAVSHLDRNRLSPRDDDDNTGRAGRWSAALTPSLRLGRHSLGRLELEYAQERLEAAFAPVGRVDAPLFREEWGFGGTRAIAGRRTQALSLALAPTASLRLRGERAGLDTEDGFSADRWRGSAEWSGRWRHRLRLEHTAASDADSAAAGRPEGYRDVAAYQTEWTASAAWVPNLSWQREEFVPPGASRAERRRGWQTGVRGERGRWGWTGSLGLRRDWSLGGAGWDPRSRSRDWRGELRAALGRDASASLGLGHRITETASGARTTGDNGVGRLRFASWGARHEAAVEWTAEGLPWRLPELRFVGSGEGAFDSLGNLTPGGDYRLEYKEVLDSLQQLSRGRLAYRAEWSLGGGAGPGARRVRFLTTLQSGAARIGGLQAVAFLPLPRTLTHDESIVSGNFLWRQEVQGQPTRNTETTLRLERLGRADRQTLGYAEVQSGWTEEVRWRWRAARRWSGELRVTASQREGESLTPNARTAGTLRTWNPEGTITWTPRESFTISGVGEWIQLRPSRDPQVTALRVGPRFTWALGSRSRLEGEGRWAPNLRTGAWPLLVPSEARVAWDRAFYRLDLSYRLRSHGFVGLEWLARARPGEAVVHTARAEMRAYF